MFHIYIFFQLHGCPKTTLQKVLNYSVVFNTEFYSNSVIPRSTKCDNFTFHATFVYFCCCCQGMQHDNLVSSEI